MEIRLATVADAARLAELGRSTFHETFAAQNSAEDMSAFLERTYREDLQREELGREDWKTFVAEEEGALAGFAQVRRGSTEPCVAGERPVELLRLYVDSRFHGRGAAQALMAAAQQTARDWNADVFWLGVWEHNERAKAFYRKYGFTKAGAHPFLLGSDLQTDDIMVLPMTRT